MSRVVYARYKWCRGLQAKDDAVGGRVGRLIGIRRDWADIGRLGLIALYVTALKDSFSNDDS